MRVRSALTLILAVALFSTTGVALAGEPDFGPWSQAQRVQDIPGTDPAFNTDVLDGCPFISPDGKRLFMASTRPGGLGGIDIWVASRASKSDPWGAPVNLGAPINTIADDFCPTLRRRRSHLLLRVDPARVLRDHSECRHQRDPASAEHPGRRGQASRL
jgi:WD40-like Beta Propeller Repeat